MCQHFCVSSFYRTPHIEYRQVSFNLQSFNNEKNVMFSGNIARGTRNCSEDDVKNF